jgi:TonB dependent receptor
VNGFFAFAANGIFEYDQDPPNLATCCVGLDQSTWDKSKFPAPIRYTQALGDFTIEAPNDIVGAYAQDDWKVNPRVTLNLGLRWDAEFGSLANDQTGLITKPHATPKANFQPRLGFAWDVSGSGTTIVRGGAGLYYDQVYLNVTFDQRRTNTGQQITVTTFNPNHDPSFASNPLGGKSFEDFKKTAGAANVSVIAPDATQPHVWTGAIGVAHQLTPALGVSADYVYQRSDNMLRSVDANLFCCTSNGNALPIQSGFFPELGGQVTGVGRPDSRFNIIQRFETNGLARYHGLQVAVNKRWSSNYQFVATYLLSQNRDDQNGAYSYPNNQFNLADEYGTSLADQRHRFVFNWVGRLPYDFTLSSVLYMAGGRPIAASTGGVDINGDGLAVSPQGGSFLGGDRPICGTDPQFDHGCAVLGIPNGQRVPRNALRSAPVYRFDLRVSRRFHIPRVMVEPMLEVFNLFNRENFDPAAYNNSLASAQFGQPGRSAELPYQPRQIQLAIRAQF